MTNHGTFPQATKNRDNSFERSRWIIRNRCSNKEMEMRIVTLTLISIVFSMLAQSAVHGQNGELRKTIDDYVRSACRQYSPDDPCQRSRAYATQIGHRGLFYNCDGEECKRNSPYIFWNQAHHSTLPTAKKLRTQIRCDLLRVFQRLEDGACGCDGQTCHQPGCDSRCQQAAPACDCPSCAAKQSGTNNQRLAQKTKGPVEKSRTKRIQEGLISVRQAVATDGAGSRNFNAEANSTVNTQQRPMGLIERVRLVQQANDRHQQASNTRVPSHSQSDRVLATPQTSGLVQDKPNCDCLECRLNRMRSEALEQRTASNRNAMEIRPSSQRKKVR